MKLLSFAESEPVARIKLTDGTPIVLTAIDQQLAYDGLVIGLPNERRNNRLIEEARPAAEARFGNACTPYVIEPARIPYAVKRQKYAVKSDKSAEPRGEVHEMSGQRLPHITCMARFRCPATIDPARENEFFG